MNSGCLAVNLRLSIMGAGHKMFAIKETMSSHKQENVTAKPQMMVDNAERKCPFQSPVLCLEKKRDKIVMFLFGELRCIRCFCSADDEILKPVKNTSQMCNTTSCRGPGT